MSAPEQPYLPMSVSNDVVVKRAASDGSSSYQSSKEFAEQVLEPIRDNCYPEELYEQGIKAEILEPGKNWVTGMIRLRLVVEYLGKQFFWVSFLFATQPNGRREPTR